ncbi:MAG: hypothetical protein ACU0DW_02100, partial [Shimia sp.]
LGFDVLEAADEEDRSYTIDSILASGDGMVQIVDFEGNVIAEAMVSEGANSDVLFTFDEEPTGDLRAVLIVDGEVEDESRIRVN